MNVLPKNVCLHKGKKCLRKSLQKSETPQALNHSWIVVAPDKKCVCTKVHIFKNTISVNQAPFYLKTPGNFKVKWLFNVITIERLNIKYLFWFKGGTN